MLRRYPYPLIAYKIAINSFLQSTTTTPTTQIPLSNQEKGGQTSQISQKDEVSQAPSLKETTQAILEPTKTEASLVNETPQITSPSEVPAKDETPKMAPSQQSPSIESDFKTLWNKVISQLSKPTTQSNLKDQAIIEKKEGNQIFITVITPIADMLIKNEENKKQIEQLLSHELGESVIIQSNYEKKEDYFARKMRL